MGLPPSRPRVARKKFWCRLLKCTVRYESHFYTSVSKNPLQNARLFPAISYLLCCAFQRHVLHALRNIHSLQRGRHRTGCPSRPPTGPMVGVLPALQGSTVQGGHKVVCSAQAASIREYAESLVTPLGTVQLVLPLKAPRSGFRALSEFFT